MSEYGNDCKWPALSSVLQLIISNMQSVKVLKVKTAFKGPVTLELICVHNNPHPPPENRHSLIQDNTADTVMGYPLSETP